MCVSHAYVLGKVQREVGVGANVHACARMFMSVGVCVWGGGGGYLDGAIVQGSNC